MTAGFTPLEPGSVTERKMAVQVCRECGAEIDDTGGCSFDCQFDFALVRPRDKVVVRVYNVVQTLVSETDKNGGPV